MIYLNLPSIHQYPQYYNIQYNLFIYYSSIDEVVLLENSMPMLKMSHTQLNLFNITRVPSSINMVKWTFRAALY